MNTINPNYSNLWRIKLVQKHIEPDMYHDSKEQFIREIHHLATTATTDTNLSFSVITIINQILDTILNTAGKEEFVQFTNDVIEQSFEDHKMHLALEDIEDLVNKDCSTGCGGCHHSAQCHSNS